MLSLSLFIIPPSFEIVDARIRQINTGTQLDSQLTAKKSDQRKALFNGLKAQLNPYSASVIGKEVDAESAQASERVEREMARRRIEEGKQKSEGQKTKQGSLAETYAARFADPKATQLLKTLLETLKNLKQANPDEVLKELAKHFSDVSDQYEALRYAEEALLDEGDAELAKLTKEGQELLMERSGPEVRAGLNILKEAKYAAEEGLGTIQDLRDFYRENILSQEGIAQTYRALRNEYGPGKLREGLDFLLRAGSSDLDAEGPSIERSHLKAIMDNFYEVGVVNNISRNLANLLARMRQNFGEGISNDVEVLMDELFRLVEALRVDHGIIAAIPPKMGAKELAWQIYFLTGLYEQLRLLPVKIYPSNDHRTRLLNATQEALDFAIEEEEEAEEEI